MLPYLRETQKSRTFIKTFGGYNHTTLVQENEMYDGYNFSVDSYPALTIRKSRANICELAEDKIHAVLDDTEGKILLTEEDGILLLRIQDKSDGRFYSAAVVGATVEDAKYTLVRIGVKILIYPCGVVYDTITRKTENYEQKHVVKNFKIINVYKKENEYIEVKEDLDEKKKNGYYVKAIFTQDGVKTRFFEIIEGEDFADGEGNDGLTIATDDIYLKVTFEPDFYGIPHHPKINVITDEYRDGVLQLREDYEKNSVWNEQECALIIPGYMSFHQIVVNNGEATGLATPRATLECYANDKKIDFIVECHNRLWGCLYDGNVNEIFCTALGSYSDWSLKGYIEDALLADSAWTASVGSPGKFTGAAVVGNTPIFFKENVIHKVYPSSTGAHQIHTITARGVQEGSHNSIARVGELYYYKTTRDVVCFDGSNITYVSTALGNTNYSNAVGGADGDNYVLYCKDSENRGHIFVYNTRLKIWHREQPLENSREYFDKQIFFMLSSGNSCEYVTSGQVIKRGLEDEKYEKDIPFMLESGNIGMDSPDQRYLCRLDLRVELSFGCSLAIYVQYDSDGAWRQTARLSGTSERPKTESISIMPERCDHFRYKLTGKGRITLYGISKIYEETENR